MVKLRENKVLLLGVAGAVLVTAGALFLTFRSYQKAEEGQRQIAAVRQKISEAREKRRQIPALEKDVIILRSNVEEYVKILPEDKHIHNFINTINRFEQESGITMTKLDAPPRRGGSASAKQAFDRIAYKLKIAGTMKSMLGFINKFENYERFVAIEDFQFRPERQGEEDQKDVLLSGSLDLETYVYNGAGGNAKPVEIRDFELKREALREQIIAQRNTVEIHRYRLDATAVDVRRDLFRDPRQSMAAATKAGMPTAERLEKQKRFVAWTRAELKEIRDMITAEENEPLIIRQMELKKQIDERVANLNSQLAAARTDRQVSAGPLVQELEREVIEPLERIIQERRIAVRTGLGAEDLKIILGKMEHFFKKGDLAQVVAQFDMVAGQIGAVSTEDEEIRRLVQEIYSLKNQAMVITEFSLRPIKIHGIIAQKGSPVAIINGRVYEQGQMLDADVKIHDIRPEEVEFVYREVRIVRRWE